MILRWVNERKGLRVNPRGFTVSYTQLQNLNKKDIVFIIGGDSQYYSAHFANQKSSKYDTFMFNKDVIAHVELWFKASGHRILNDKEINML